MQIISAGSGTGSLWEKQKLQCAILVINCFWDFACLMLDLNFEFMFFVVYLKRKMLNCINVKH